MTIVAGTTALAFLVLVPVAYAGFSALSRAESKRLTAWFVLFNTLLLIPERSALAAAVIGLGMLGSLLFLDLRHFSRQALMKNKEGLISRTILTVPLVFFSAAACSIRILRFLAACCWQLWALLFL